MDSVKTKVEEGNKGVASLCLRNDMPTKLFIIVLLVSTCTLTSFAQVSFGVKGGVNSAKTIYNKLPLGFTSNNEPSWKSGLQIGIFGQFKLNEKLSLIPELQFIQRGYRVTYAATNYSSSVEINYLELPIFLSYRIKSVGIDFGPNISYQLSSSLKKAYENFDFGLEGGLRIYLNKKIFMTARYYYGMMTVSEITFFNSAGGISGNVTEQNRSFQISLGYKIK